MAKNLRLIVGKVRADGRIGVKFTTDFRGERIRVGDRWYKVTTDNRIHLPASVARELGAKKGDKIVVAFGGSRGIEQDPETHRWKQNFALIPMFRGKKIEPEFPPYKIEKIEGIPVKIPVEEPESYGIY
jgi:bifunctional DNA-binding transcriptional regulator/antitoxin component of YhaV-PrlF toxin-antitoxin module